MEKRGLSTIEAKELLKKTGPNELPSSEPKSIWKIALEVVKEPMFLLLISCGVLYMLLGDYREGAILLSTILIIIFITFYQSQKTEKALDALRKLSAPMALVIRDNTELRVPAREIVPQDVIIVTEGDRIPADALLLDGLNLTIDESVLTGESIPVTKSVQPDAPGSPGRLFSGTLVVQGRGFAQVTHTGVNTEFGKIGVSLKNIEQTGTRLQVEMKVLIRNLFIIGVILSIAVVLAFYFTRGNFIQSLLSGLSAAMALLPEEFPVVLTVFLALGAWRLSKQNVLTRKPSAIETLGSATVLCSDKTGTITQNKMEVAAIHFNGKTFEKNEFKAAASELKELIHIAHGASPANTIDPMEKAISACYENLYNQPAPTDKLTREYPLSKQLFATSHVYQSGIEGSYTVYCKGAPEAVLGMCRLNPTELGQYLSQVSAIAARGYRVIAMASAKFTGNVLPELQNNFEFSFSGLIGFEDPVRPEIAGAIKECLAGGIKVIMITGDFPVTAISIARQIGMPEGIVLSGSEINDMSDAELRDKIAATSICARVAPDQKLRIVHALQERGEIVAMTGDGVNDAPALKAADIGVAMGNKGTDVAREASALVLLDDNFASIVSAIRAGRRIFDNLQKAMSYIIAVHVPIIGLTLLPALVPGLPVLLLPLHIVFMELIIDPACSVAFESEQEEKGIMNRLPRKPSEKFFGIKKMLFSFIEGIMLLAMVMVVYFLSIREGHVAEEVRAITFSALIIGNVFLILSTLSKTRSFISSFKEKNIALLVIICAALLLLFLIISVPFLRSIFGFKFPGYQHFILSVIAASGMLAVLEVIKFWRIKKS